jgi:hypothetical protein
MKTKLALKVGGAGIVVAISFFAVFAKQTFASFWRPYQENLSPAFWGDTSSSQIIQNQQGILDGNPFWTTLVPPVPTPVPMNMTTESVPPLPPLADPVNNFMQFNGIDLSDTSRWQTLTQDANAWFGLDKLNNTYHKIINDNGAIIYQTYGPNNVFTEQVFQRFNFGEQAPAEVYYNDGGSKVLIGRNGSWFLTKKSVKNSLNLDVDGEGRPIFSTSGITWDSQSSYIYEETPGTGQFSKDAAGNYYYKVKNDQTEAISYRSASTGETIEPPKPPPNPPGQPGQMAPEGQIKSFINSGTIDGLGQIDPDKEGTWNADKTEWKYYDDGNKRYIAIKYAGDRIIYGEYKVTELEALGEFLRDTRIADKTTAEFAGSLITKQYRKINGSFGPEGEIKEGWSLEGKKTEISDITIEKTGYNAYKIINTAKVVTTLNGNNADDWYWYSDDGKQYGRTKGAHKDEIYSTDNGRLLEDAEWKYYYGKNKGVIRENKATGVWEIYRGGTLPSEPKTGDIGFKPDLGTKNFELNKDILDALKKIMKNSGIADDAALIEALLNDKQVKIEGGGKIIKFGETNGAVFKSKAIFELNEANELVKYRYITNNNKIAFWERDKNGNAEIIRDVNLALDAIKNTLSSKLKYRADFSFADMKLEDVEYAFETNRVIFNNIDLGGNLKNSTIFVNFDNDALNYAGVIASNRLYISDATNNIIVENLDLTQITNPAFDVRTFLFGIANGIKQIIVPDSNGLNYTIYRLDNAGKKIEGTAIKLDRDVLESILIEEGLHTPGQAFTIDPNKIKIGKNGFVIYEISTVGKTTIFALDFSDIGNNNIKVYKISDDEGIKLSVYKKEGNSVVKDEDTKTIVDRPTLEKIKTMHGLNTLAAIVSKFTIKADPLNSKGNVLEITEVDLQENKKADYRFTLDEKGVLTSYAVRNLEPDADRPGQHKTVSITVYDIKQNTSITIKADDEKWKKLLEGLQLKLDDVLKYLYDNGKYENGVLTFVDGNGNTYIIKVSNPTNTDQLEGGFVYKIDANLNVEVYLRDKDGNWAKKFTVTKDWFQGILAREGSKDFNAVTPTKEDIIKLLSTAQALEDRVMITGTKATYVLVNGGDIDNTNGIVAYVYKTGESLRIFNSANQIGKDDGAILSIDAEYLEAMLGKMKQALGKDIEIGELLKKFKYQAVKNANGDAILGYKLIIDEITKDPNKPTRITGGKYHTFWVSLDEKDLEGKTIKNISYVMMDYTPGSEKIKLFTDVTNGEYLELSRTALAAILGKKPEEFSPTLLNSFKDKFKAYDGYWILSGVNDTVGLIKFYKPKSGESWQAIQIKGGEIFVHTDLNKWGDVKTDGTGATIKISSAVLTRVGELTGLGSNQEELLKAMEYNKDNGRIIVTKGSLKDNNLEVYGFALNDKRTKVESAFKVFKDKDTGEISVAVFGATGTTPVITLKELDVDEILDKIGIEDLEGELDKFKALAGTLTTYLSGRFDGKEYNQLLLKNKGNYYVFNLKVEEEDGEEEGTKIKVGRIEDYSKVLEVSVGAINNIKTKIAEDRKKAGNKDKDEAKEITFADMFFNVAEGRVEALVTSGKDKFRYEMWFDKNGTQIGDNDDHLSEAGKLHGQLNQQLEMINADPLSWEDFLKTGAIDTNTGQLKLEEKQIDQNGTKKNVIVVKTLDRNGAVEELYIDPETHNILVEIATITRTIKDAQGQDKSYTITATNYYDWSSDGLSATIKGEMQSGNQKMGEITGTATFGSGTNGVRNFQNLHVEITYTQGGKDTADYKIEGNKAIKTEKIERSSYTQTITTETTFEVVKGKREDKERTITSETKYKDSNEGRWWNTHKFTRMEKKVGKDWKVKEGKAADDNPTLSEEFSDGSHTIKIKYDVDSEGRSGYRVIDESKGGVTAHAEETIEGSGDFLQPGGSIKVKIKGTRIGPDGNKFPVGRGDDGEEEVTVTRTYTKDQSGRVVSYQDVYEKATDEQIKKNAEALLGEKASEFLSALTSGEDSAVAYLADLLKQSSQSRGEEISDEQAQAAARQYYEQIVSGGKVSYDGQSAKVLKVEAPKEPKKQDQKPPQQQGQGPQLSGSAGPGGGSGSGRPGAKDNFLPEAGARSPGRDVSREANNLLSDFHKIATEGNWEKILDFLRKQGWFGIEGAHAQAISSFKSQRIARAYRLKGAVLKKFKDVLKKEGKEAAKKYLKKLGLSDKVIEEIFGTEEKPIDEKEAIKKAQSALLKEYGVSKEDLDEFEAGKKTLDDLLTKYKDKIPENGKTRIAQLDETEARGVLLDRAKDEQGNSVLENITSINNILDILEGKEITPPEEEITPDTVTEEAIKEAMSSKEKYDAIVAIMKDELGLEDADIQELVGTDPAKLIQSELYKYNEKNAGEDYLKNEVGLPEFTAKLIATGNADGLDELLKKVENEVNGILGGKVSKDEWEKKKDTVINGIMKALFGGELIPDADVEGIVKKIIDEAKITLTEDKDKTKDDKLEQVEDRDGLIGPIKDRLRNREDIGDFVDNPLEGQAVRKQAEEKKEPVVSVSISEERRKEEEKRREEIRRLLERKYNSTGR